ncbi:unnamed protein product, partial [Adineta ricciae]
QWKKVQGIYKDINTLCQFIKETAKYYDEEYKEFSCIALQDLDKRDVDELGQSFMYTQLLKEILLEMKYGTTCNKELAEYCRKKKNVLNNDLKRLDEFEQNYKQEKAVWWYTTESCIYGLVNKVLREQKFDFIIKFGFFIKDLHLQIEQLHEDQASKKKDNPTLYRGITMTEKQFKELHKSEKGLLAFNNFVSTSRDPTIAQGFIQRSLGANHRLIGILFIINVDPSISSTKYADIEEISDVHEESETLFSLDAVFRIGSITQVQDEPQVWTVELDLSDNRDKKLNTLMDRMRLEIDGLTESYKLGSLMMKVDQYDVAEEIYNKLNDETNDEREKANIQHQLGYIKYKQGKSKEALDWYQRVLDVYVKILGNEHKNVAAVYNNIGLVYDSLNEYSKALTYYQKAQQIYEKTSANDPVLATCYNNIASIYATIGDHQSALNYYQKSSEISQKLQATNHPDYATLENNIGLIYLTRGDFKEAFKYFHNAVKIGTKSLPVDHADLTTYQTNLKMATEKLDKYK